MSKVSQAARGFLIGLCLVSGGAITATADETRSPDVAAEGTALDEARQALVAGDALVIMRHALAPGVGDPAGFRLGDCATQRNLSRAGRTEAVRIGALLRRWTEGSGGMAAFTSAWCRCRETATLLDVGPVEPLASLDSFFVERDRQADQTADLERWIIDRLADKEAAPTVLVTHQVNISALTGDYASSGEMLIITADPTADAGASGRLRVMATQAVPEPE